MRDRRDRIVSTRFSEGEWEMLRHAAAAAGMKVSEFLRRKAIAPEPAGSSELTWAAPSVSSVVWIRPPGVVMDGSTIWI